MMRCRTNEKRTYCEDPGFVLIEPYEGSLLHELIRKIGPWQSIWKEPAEQSTRRKEVQNRICEIERPCPRTLLEQKYYLARPARFSRRSGPAGDRPMRAVWDDMTCSSAPARCSALLSTCSQRVCYWNVQNAKTWTSVATESGGSHGEDTWSVCFPSQEAHDTWHGDSEYQHMKEDEDSWYEIYGESEEEAQADEYIAWLSRQAA